MIFFASLSALADTGPIPSCTNGDEKWKKIEIVVAIAALKRRASDTTRICALKDPIKAFSSNCNYGI